MKLSKEVLGKIKNLEIYTRRLLSGMHVGDYSTAQKGSGFEFDQLDEYQIGDDIRFIDWKGTARAQKLLVRKYLEERNRTIMLFVDISSSSFYSSSELLRYEMMAQVAGVIALVGNYGKDHVGAVFFADTVEHVIPPGRGNEHVHAILKCLFEYPISSQGNIKKTDLNVPFSYMAANKKKGALMFVISDFIGNSFENSLRVVKSKYEIIAVRCLDKNENQFPNISMIELQDCESGQKFNLDTRGSNSQKINQMLERRLKEQNKIFGKFGVDVLDLKCGDSFIADVVRFFRRRMMY